MNTENSVIVSGKGADIYGEKSPVKNRTCCFICKGLNVDFRGFQSKTSHPEKALHPPLFLICGLKQV